MILSYHEDLEVVRSLLYRWLERHEYSKSPTMMRVLYPGVASEMLGENVGNNCAVIPIEPEDMGSPELTNLARKIIKRGFFPIEVWREESWFIYGLGSDSLTFNALKVWNIYEFEPERTPDWIHDHLKLIPEASLATYAKAVRADCDQFLIKVLESLTTIPSKSQRLGMLSMALALVGRFCDDQDSNTLVEVCHTLCLQSHIIEEVHQWTEESVARRCQAKQLRVEEKLDSIVADQSWLMARKSHRDVLITYRKLL